VRHLQQHPVLGEDLDLQVSVADEVVGARLGIVVRPENIRKKNDVLIAGTDARGQFVANFAEPHYHQRLPAAVGSLFREPAGLASRLPAFYQDLLARLEPELRAVDFTGPIGLDALVYRDDHGGVRLKPVVEINPRYTLGRVLVELMRQTCQNSAGLLRLVNPAQLRAEGVADFPAYARALAEKFPLQFEDRPEPRLREGALCLNDPAEAKACLAVFQVARSFTPLRPETGAA